MKVIAIGGPLHGQPLEVADNTNNLDAIDEGGKQVRYIKRLWAKSLNEMTREVGRSAYFVLGSLSDQEASDLVIKHIKEHGAQ